MKKIHAYACVHNEYDPVFENVLLCTQIKNPLRIVDLI